MLYELRTYNLRPGSLPEVLKRFGEAYRHRRRYSEMAGLWFTEFGPLNQIVHIWPYASLDERSRIRAESSQDPHWPPSLTDFQREMTSEIFLPFPFSPEPKPGRFGPFYELRSYLTRAGALPRIMAHWEKKLAARSALSPLLLAMYSEIGPLNKFVHLWPYESLEQRAETRRKAVESGVWPPEGVDDLVAQESKLLLPAEFSPLQ
jgi:hypothetical protein